MDQNFMYLHGSEPLLIALLSNFSPAAVKTAMFDKPDGPGGNPERMKKYLDWCCAAIPLGRIGEVAEVARLATFLGSKEAKFITGTTFPIDGSYSNTSYIPKLKH